MAVFYGGQWNASPFLSHPSTHTCTHTHTQTCTHSVWLPSYILQVWMWVVPLRITIIENSPKILCYDLITSRPFSVLDPWHYYLEAHSYDFRCFKSKLPRCSQIFIKVGLWYRHVSQWDWRRTVSMAWSLGLYCALLGSCTKLVNNKWSS